MKILIFILILIFIIYNSIQTSHFNNLNFLLETEKDKYRLTSDTAVSILKPTLTLYYDRYDKYSKYFYDDAKVVVGKKILELDSRKKNLEEEYNYLEETFNYMINSFKTRTKIEEVIGSNNSLSDNKIEDFNLNIKHHYIFRTKTGGYKKFKINTATYDRYGEKDLLLNEYIDNFYTTLKSSKYDYSDLITKIKELQDYADSKLDIFNSSSNVKSREGRDFGWNFGKKSKRLTFIKGNADEFNEIVNEINLYLKNNYQDLINLLKEELHFELNNEFQVSNLGPWNQIKLIYEHDFFPFLNHKMINLEEVLCQDGKMPECVSKKIVTFKPGNYKDLMAPSDVENFTSMVGQFGIERDINIQKSGIMIDSERTRQYPRNEEIVNKLPKIIFTYQKYDSQGLIDNKITKMIEYEGIYNINNQFIRAGTNNILKFLEYCFREYLEITEGGDLESKKRNHKQIINSIDENLVEHDFEEVNFNLAEEIKNDPNFLSIIKKFTSVKSVPNLFWNKKVPEFILE